MFKMFQLLLGLTVLLGFSQCKPTESFKENKTIQMDINMNEKVYYQEWVAGMKGGGSGINLYIDESVLDVRPLEAYFRTRKVKLVKNNSFYIGAFKTNANQLKDYVSDSDIKQEYGNEGPDVMVDFPFELKDDEAMVSYEHDGKIKFIKLESIYKKPMLAYPSAPNNNRKL